MLVLIAIGLVAGLITSISPCVLPVLPVVLADGARIRESTPDDPDPDNPDPCDPDPCDPDPGDPAPGDGCGSAAIGTGVVTGQRRTTRSWRPFGIVAGLVISFCVSTLLGSYILDALGLPQDLLRWVGIAVLVLLGAGMIVAPLGELLERPFARLSGRPVDPDGNPLVIGLGVGLLFVPCAGPVLATIAVVGASHQVGFDAVVLTVAFGVGAGAPLLLLALAGSRLVSRTAALRRRGRALRTTSGVVMIAVAAVIAFNLTDGLQRLVPGYTNALQQSVEGSAAANRALQGVTGRGAPTAEAAAPEGQSSCNEGSTSLQDCGPAPALTGITGWLNTPGNAPLDLASLRGKVVLIDFWTYSCINCQRTLPHLEAWDQAYRDAGLVIIGVHTPEFAFEHVTANVESQAAALGVHYPIAIDNDYGTWNAYQNRYWPAEYLIDATGNVRSLKFGEGDYAGSELLIRQLLGAANPSATLPPPTDVDEATLSPAQTPETYLGYQYPQSVSGTTPVHDAMHDYAFPSTTSPDTFSLSGSWQAGAESVTAGPGTPQIRLNYEADDVYLVLGGTGTVTVDVGGRVSTLQVSGPPKLYTLTSGTSDARAQLTLTTTPGVEAYDFTFG